MRASIIVLLTTLTLANCSIFGKQRQHNHKAGKNIHLGVEAIKQSLLEAKNKIDTMDQFSQELNKALHRAEETGKVFNSVINGNGVLDAVKGGVKGLFGFKLYEEDMKEVHMGYSLEDLKKESKSAYDDINSAMERSDELKELTVKARQVADRAVSIANNF